jgi:NAD(P)-dependent dehydrogenase (short-subunit alcohol dehydrogenase family)
MTVLDRFRLDGKRVLITGGSRGFGRIIALAVAEAGADVVLIARDLDALARTAGELRRRGSRAWTYSADVADPATCEIYADACWPKGCRSMFSSTSSAGATSTSRSRRATS